MSALQRLFPSPACKTRCGDRVCRATVHVKTAEPPARCSHSDVVKRKVGTRAIRATEEAPGVGLGGGNNVAIGEIPGCEPGRTARVGGQDAGRCRRVLRKDIGVDGGPRWGENLDVVPRYVHGFTGDVLVPACASGVVQWHGNKSGTRSQQWERKTEGCARRGTQPKGRQVLSQPSAPPPAARRPPPPNTHTHTRVHAIRHSRLRDLEPDALTRAIDGHVTVEDVGHNMVPRANNGHAAIGPTLAVHTLDEHV